MSYYFMAAITQHDADTYLEYQQKTAAMLGGYECVPLSANAPLKLLGGEAEPNMVVLLEFPSESHFDNWWNSDEYAVVRKLREKSSTTVIGVGFGGEVNIPAPSCVP
jgi:uncharacterized protein (DUF1330 family)